MMNTGLTFGSEGPMMEGTWYNTQTGDSFTVRDSFFEDNQFVVTTTDGRYLKYEQIQDYIKSDKPIEMEKPKPKQEVLPTEVTDLLEGENYDDMIMADDLAMIRGKAPVTLGNLKDSMTTNPYPYNPNPAMQVVSSEPINTNYDIISKALTKRTLPDFQIGINWLGCPVKEMAMLMDLMDVQESEIVDWYLSQVDTETTTAMIKEVIKDYLYKQIHKPEITETECVAVTSEAIKTEPVVDIAKTTANKKKTTKKKK